LQKREEEKEKTRNAQNFSLETDVKANLNNDVWCAWKASYNDLQLFSFEN